MKGNFNVHWLSAIHAIRTSSLINVGTAGEHRGTADRIGKINCCLPGVCSISSPAETGPRDIEQRYTLFALAINQRSRPFRYQTLRESNSFARSTSTWGVSSLQKKKRESFSFVTCWSRIRVAENFEKLSWRLLRRIYEYQPLRRNIATINHIRGYISAFEVRNRRNVLFFLRAFVNEYLLWDDIKLI